MSEMLNDLELKAIGVTTDLIELMSEIIGDGASREGDWAEFASHIHVIQHLIMSQAAARAYPDYLRLLGQTL